MLTTILLIPLLFFTAATVPMGMKKLRGVRERSRRDRHVRTPLASIIAPCKGIEFGLEANLKAMLAQDYPRYEVVFVVEDRKDPAAACIEKAIAEVPAGANVSARLLIAGLSDGCAQKAHNIRIATDAADPESEVFAYIDSDVRPHADWLRELVAPLFDNPSVGASTGYRWHLADRFDLALAVRTVWDALVIVNSLRGDRANFAWGGSMAITRANYDGLRVAERWRTALSEDLSLTALVDAAGKHIAFAPRCVSASYDDAGLGSTLDFIFRQSLIARVYRPAVWRSSVAWAFAVTAIFYASIVMVGVRALQGEVLVAPIALLVLVYLMSAIRGWLLVQWILVLLPEHARALRRIAWTYVLLTPLGWFVHTFTALRAMFSRRMTWRGTIYELTSATETRIVARS